jgi:selenocysteine lyase/cysteine desulfurase
VTLSELQSDEALRRHEFPVVQTQVFLSHAAVCPLPYRVARAISQCATASTTGDQEDLFFPGAISTGRELAARLIECQPEEIALVGPTSLALSMVAAGLSFEPGDNVLVYFDDYPSNVYPWLALAAQGVEVRRIRTTELGRVLPEDVLKLVDARTRLASLASCHFIAGLRIDVDAIGQALHERGVLFCVDAIQTVGAFPTSVRHVDFLAADAHKWMLGPCAAGILYVGREAQERLKPVMIGWHNVRCPDFVAQDTLTFRNGAKRYEAGTHNLLGIVGMNAALQILLEVGVENIAADLLRKRALLVTGLQDRDWEVLHAEAGNDQSSGIVSFRKDESDLVQLHSRLLKDGVVTTLRADRQGRRFIRLSPHFYNSDDELNRFLSLL